MIKFDLDKNLHYLIAVSGGPDSMAMLDILYNEGYQFDIAHVNYHHRLEADNEEEMIKTYASKRNINVHVLNAYYQNKGNFEDWARNVRYAFFNDICSSYNLNGCIVGHHLDDHLETYLMQLKRGYVNYYGLQNKTIIKNVCIYRPFLNVSKDLLLEYCVKNNIPYSLDVTNLDTTLLRNKIRHEQVLKMSKEEKCQMVDKINQMNTELKECLLLINKLLKDDVVTVKKLSSLTVELKERLIYTWVNRYLFKTISKKRINDILNKISSIEGNEWVHIDKDYYFVKEYDLVKIIKKDVYDYKTVVEKPSIIDNDLIYFDLISNPSKFYIKEDSYPLTIEKAKPSDKVKIGNITKTIKRLWIDDKIPGSLRLYWPKIVNNKGEIIFVPRNSKDDNGLFLVKKR